MRTVLPCLWLLVFGEPIVEYAKDIKSWVFKNCVLIEFILPDHFLPKQMHNSIALSVLTY